MTRSQVAFIRGVPGNVVYVPSHPVRFVTSTALFDGHDAAINIMRCILQAQGAEVVHLGHDRSVREVVDAVLDEDAQGVAVSSYQGGHVGYFEYLTGLLAQSGAGHVRVFGGGVIASLLDQRDLQERPELGTALRRRPGNRLL